MDAVMEGYRHLLDKPLPISHTDVGVDSLNDMTGYVSWIVTAAQLPAVAPQIALDTGKSGVPTKGPWAMEDWYRALALMKHAYRAQSSSRATAGVKVQDVQAELPSFLQAVDVGGRAHEEVVGVERPEDGMPSGGRAVFSLTQQVANAVADDDVTDDDADPEYDEDAAFAAVEGYIEQVTPALGRPSIIFFFI